MTFDLASVNGLLAILAVVAPTIGAVYAMRAQVSALVADVQALGSAVKNISNAISALDSERLELENKILREAMDAERRHEEKFVTLAESAASLADMRRRLETLELNARR